MLTTEKLRGLKHRINLNRLAKDAGLADKIVYSITRNEHGIRGPRELTSIEARALSAQLVALSRDLHKAIGK